MDRNSFDLFKQGSNKSNQSNISKTSKLNISLSKGIMYSRDNLELFKDIKSDVSQGDSFMNLRNRSFGMNNYS